MVQITLILRHGKVVAACLAEQESDILPLLADCIPHSKKLEFGPAVMVKGSVIRVERLRGEWMALVDLPENLPPGKDVPFIVVGDGDLMGPVAAAMDKRPVVEMDIEEPRRHGRFGGFGGDFGAGPAGDPFPDSLDDDLDDIFSDLDEPGPSIPPIPEMPADEKLDAAAPVPGDGQDADDGGQDDEDRDEGDGEEEETD